MVVAHLNASLSPRSGHRFPGLDADREPLSRALKNPLAPGGTMGPYDQGWDRSNRYDRGFRGPGFGQGGGGPVRGYPGAQQGQRGYGGYRFGPDPGYGGDFRPHPGMGGHIDRQRMPEDGINGPDESFRAWAGGDEAVYGPARYGLGPYHDRLHRRRRPDGELKTEVEEALFYDTWVDADAIQVDVKDGIVTLRGELPDYEEIRYATDDAWDVDGVRGVRTELTVRPEDDAQRPSQSREE
jgi:BON domain